MFRLCFGIRSKMSAFCREMSIRCKSVAFRQMGKYRHLSQVSTNWRLYVYCRQFKVRGMSYRFTFFFKESHMCSCSDRYELEKVSVETDVCGLMMLIEKKRSELFLQISKRSKMAVCYVKDHFKAISCSRNIFIYSLQIHAVQLMLFPIETPRCTHYRRHRLQGIKWQS